MLIKQRIKQNTMYTTSIYHNNNIHIAFEQSEPVRTIVNNENITTFNNENITTFNNENITTCGIIMDFSYIVGYTYTKYRIILKVFLFFV